MFLTSCILHALLDPASPVSRTHLCYPCIGLHVQPAFLHNTRAKLLSLTDGACDCRPQPKYAPWFDVVLKCARLAVSVLGTLSEEARTLDLSLDLSSW